MAAESPAVALGRYASDTRDLLVEVIRSRHARAAEGHAASESRYTLGFGSQWRDLLDDTRDAMAVRGFQTRTLKPAGYRLPVVNDCLVYVWRAPSAEAVERFASSPTRKNSFAAEPPHPMLIDPPVRREDVPAEVSTDQPELERVVALAGKMPLVLVMAHSSPRGLQLIEWAIAVLDESGRTQLLGREGIWTPEVAGNDVQSVGESFDSGSPVRPVIEVQEQEDEPDA